MNEFVTQLHDLLPDIARLAASAAFGGLVGYERERKGQAAGFRTNMLVAVAACLLGQLSLYISTIAHADAATDRCRLVVRIATDEDLDWHGLVQMVRAIPDVASVHLGESGVP